MNQNQPKYEYSQRSLPKGSGRGATRQLICSPLDLGKAQVYQYTSGVPSASLFRPLAAAIKVKDEMPKTHLQTLANAAAALGHTDQPQAVVQEKLQPQQKVLAQASTPVATRVQASEQKVPTPKVSHEWVHRLCR